MGAARFNAGCPVWSLRFWSDGRGIWKSSLFGRASITDKAIRADYSRFMPQGLHRFQHTGNLHFITFSCYHRAPLRDSPASRHTFELTLERVRRWYGFFVTGYVVMPEHVHLLLSEPERGYLGTAIQMLKQITSADLRPGTPSLSLRSLQRQDG